MLKTILFSLLLLVATAMIFEKRMAGESPPEVVMVTADSYSVAEVAVNYEFVGYDYQKQSLEKPVELRSYIEKIPAPAMMPNVINFDASRPEPGWQVSAQKENSKKMQKFGLRNIYI